MYKISMLEILPTEFTLELLGTFKIIDNPNIIKTQQSKIENYFMVF